MGLGYCNDCGAELGHRQGCARLPKPEGVRVGEDMSTTLSPDTTYKLNGTSTVAVATDTYWIPIDVHTPHGVKVQLLGAGGVATYGVYHGDRFWTHWCPVPKRRAE